MGHVRVPVTLSWKRSKRVMALVDTGATHAVIPLALSKELETPESIRQQRVQLADGSIQRMPETIVHVKLNGRDTGAVAVIVPKGEVLLGVEVLESLGLAVDPARKRIFPTRPYAARLGGYRSLR